MWIFGARIPKESFNIRLHWPPNARDNKTLSFNPRQSTKHPQTQTKHPKGPGNPTNARRTAKIGLKSGKNRSKQNFQIFSNFSPSGPTKDTTPSQAIYPMPARVKNAQDTIAVRNDPNDPKGQSSDVFGPSGKTPPRPFKSNMKHFSQCGQAFCSIMRRCLLGTASRVEVHEGPCRRVSNMELITKIEQVLASIDGVM